MQIHISLYTFHKHPFAVMIRVLSLHHCMYPSKCLWTFIPRVFLLIMWFFQISLLPILICRYLTSNVCSMSQMFLPVGSEAYIEAYFLLVKAYSFMLKSLLDPIKGRSELMKSRKLKLRKITNALTGHRLRLRLHRISLSDSSLYLGFCLSVLRLSGKEYQY